MYFSLSSFSVYYFMNISKIPKYQTIHCIEISKTAVQV